MVPSPGDGGRHGHGTDAAAADQDAAGGPLHATARIQPDSTGEIAVPAPVDDPGRAQGHDRLLPAGAVPAVARRACPLRRYEAARPGHVVETENAGRGRRSPGRP